MYNPLLQVKGHQTTLQNILRAAGIRTPVRTAVYFANPNAEVQISGSRNVFTARDSQPLDQSVRRLLNGGGAGGHRGGDCRHPSVLFQINSAGCFGSPGVSGCFSCIK